MANQEVVGILRAILTADTAQFDASMKRSAATVTAFGEETTRAVADIAKKLGGQALIKNAQDTAAAIQLIGGASKLTAAEAARLEPTITAAINKLKVMGVEVPASLTQTQASLRKVTEQTTAAGTATTGLTGRVKEMALGYATGMLSVQAFLGAGRQVVDFLKESVQEFLEAEKTQRQLTAALQAQGLAVPEVLTQFDALAQKYQKLSVHEDDAIKQTQALLVQVGGVLPSEMDKALDAVTNLSAGLGIDLRDATMMVAKAFEDNFGALKKAGVDIDEARVKVDGMDYVLGQIQKRFDGQAQAEVASYAGQIAQTEVAWKNLKEEFGRVFVESGALKLGLLGVQIVLAKVASDLMFVTAVLSTPLPKGDPLGLVVWAAQVRTQIDMMTDSLKKMRAETSSVSPEVLNVEAVVRDLRLRDKKEADARAVRQKALELDKVAKERAAEATRRLAEEEAKFLDQLQRFNPDYTLRTKAFLRSLHDGTEQLPERIRDVSEALQGLWDTGRRAPFDPIAAFFAGGGDTSGKNLMQGIKLNLAVPDQAISSWQKYGGIVKTTAQVMLDLTRSGTSGWQEMVQAMAPMIGILSDYGEAMSRATNDTERAAAAQAASMNIILGAVTMGVNWVNELADSKANIAEWKRDLTNAFADLGYSAEEMFAIYNKAMNLPASNRQVFTQQSLNKLLEEARERANQVSKSIGSIVTVAQRVGGTVPAALQPMLDSILQSTRLSKDAREQLEALGGKAKWEYLDEAAQRFGVAKDALGSSINTERLGAAANEINNFLKQATEAGGNRGQLLAGLADEIVDLFKQAKETGSSLPTFLRPWVDELKAAGLLMDEFGNQIDPDSFSWTDKIKSTFELMADYLKEILDTLRFGLPNAAASGVGAMKNAIGGGIDPRWYDMPMPRITMPGGDWSASLPHDVYAGQPVTGIGSSMTKIELNMDGRKVADILVPLFPGATKRYAVGR